MTRPTTPWTPGPARPTTVPYLTPNRPASVWTPGADLPSQRELGVSDTEYAGLLAELSACAVLESDALFRTRPSFLESFSAGKAQSVGPLDDSVSQGRFHLVLGSVAYHDSGGPEGGGYLESLVDQSGVSVVPPTPPGYPGGNLAWNQLEGPGEMPLPRQMSALTRHNLFGFPVTTPKILHDYGHTVLRVWPDMTLRAEWVHTAGGIISYTLCGPPTDYLVPADGWFGLESEVSLSPYLYNRGGAVLANLYHDAAARLGDPAIRLVGVRTHGEHNQIVNFYSQFTARTPLHGGLGTFVMLRVVPEGDRKFVGDAFVGPAMPVQDGVVQSNVSYEHFEYFGLSWPDADPFLYGGNLVWGEAERWRNVRSLLHSARVSEEPLYLLFGAGNISEFTGRWLPPPNGPYPPLFPANESDRVQLLDGAADFYRVALDRENVVEILAVAPFALAGSRVILATHGGFLGLGGFAPWALTGPYPLNDPVNGFEYPYGGAHAAYRLLIKAADGTVTPMRAGQAHTPLGDDHWSTLLGYSLGPDSVAVVADSDPAALPQVGVKSEMSFLDAIAPPIDPAKRWAQVDIGQAGLDVLYRKRRVVVNPAPDRPPIADFAVLGSGPGFRQIYDTSVDFNGTIDDLLSGVVSRVMDWGDGSPPEAIEAALDDSGTEEDGRNPTWGGIQRTYSHTYTLHGTYTMTLTATNAAGLTATKTLDVVVPVALPFAALSAATDDAFPDGLHVNFTDASFNEFGTIVGWAWTFGDGGTSALQNPSHAYALAGPYTVSLTVTDDLGQTATSTVNITVPLPVTSGCPEFPVAPGAYVMGDDFIGTNAPLPAFLDLATFVLYYWGYIYREVYSSGYGGEGDFDLDFVKTFSGRPTLRMYWGLDPALPPGGYRTGAGWLSYPTDDGSPEVYYNDSPTFTPGPYSEWFRLRLCGETGIMNDPDVAEGDIGLGLLIMEISPRGPYIDIALRAGKIFLDIFSRFGDVSAEVALLVGLESLFFGREDFGELIVLYEGDQGGDRLRVRVWAGDACTLEGVEPLVDSGWIDDDTNKGDPYYSYFNYFFGANHTLTLKTLWVGGHSRYPADIYPNPYNVALT